MLILHTNADTPQQNLDLFGIDLKFSPGSFQGIYTTAGPPRAGFAIIDFVNNGVVGIDQYFYSSHASAGSYSADGSIFGVGMESCVGDFCQAGVGGTGIVLAFTLGVPFDLAYSFSGGANGDLFNPSVQGDAYFQVRFVEANGQTPVDSSRIPEPSTVSLLAAGVLLLAFRRGRSVLF